MDIRYEVRGRIATITLNRPDKMNAISPEMYGAITDRLVEIDRDPDVLVGVITGAGEKAFTAGADLKTVHTAGPLGGSEWAALRPDRFDLGLNVQKPLIAAVNGYCLAGGLELALLCDVRIAAEHAQFGCPEVKWNLLHGYGAHRLPQIVGLSNALLLLLSGQFISAHEAHRIGLVQDVVSTADLLQRTYGLANVIANNAPVAVRMTKELATRSHHLSLEDELRLYAEFNRVLAVSPDLREGLSAFAERRPPSYHQTNPAGTSGATETPARGDPPVT